MVELSESPVANHFVESDGSNSYPPAAKKLKKKSKKKMDQSSNEASKVKKDKKRKKDGSLSNVSQNTEDPPLKKVKTDKKIQKKANEQLNAAVIDGDSAEEQGNFAKFRITELTKDLLHKQGIKYLFPIQIKTFNHVYDGADVVAQARTGTGKTLSFSLPLIEKLLAKDIKRVRGRAPQVLIMAPTRELAIQVHNDVSSICQSLATVCVYGGTPYYPQETAMRNGVDIVVGTPGRILDHLNKGNLKLGATNHVVLDEVDNMLDMGFAPTVEEILQFAYTSDRETLPQTLLFSATCPAWVYKTAEKYMRKDETVHVDTIGSSLNRTATTVEHLAIRCHYHDRAGCIGAVVQVHSGMHGRAMIFTETKKEANELVVCDALQQLKAQVMHGDIEQKQREITLKAYRDGSVKCLVATNVAARGLDIPEIDLVVQTSPPSDIESYIHRAGRTGRAGRSGVCVCFYKPRQDEALRRVERSAGIKFKFVGPPQPKDIVKASISDSVTSLQSIKKSVSSEFLEHAKTLAESHEGGALGALSSALAWISGAASLQSRSLLNAQLDHTTWILNSNFELRFVGFVYSTLEKSLGSEVRHAATGMRFTADKKGGVFDLPDQFTEQIEENWRDSPALTLRKAEELPELLEDSRPSFRSNSYGGRFGGGGGRGRSGFSRGRGGGGVRGGGYRRGGSGGGFKRQWGNR